MFASSATVAWAQPRVTVNEFSGPSSAPVRNQVVRALINESVVVVPSSDVEKVGSSDPTTISAQLELNAFIDGKVTKRGRRFSARISVVEGATGKTVRSMTFSARNAKSLGNVVRQGFWNRLGDAVQGAGAAGAGGGGDSGGGDSGIVPDEAPIASGGGGGKTVVVLSFSGPGGDRVRSSVTGALSSDGHQVLEARDAERAANEEGADLDSSDGRVAVARSLRADAIITGRVQKQGRRRYRAIITVYNGADGEKVGQATFVSRTAAGVAGSAKQRFGVELGSAVAGTSAPGAADSGTPRRVASVEDDESPLDNEDADEEEDSGPTGKPSPLTVAVHFDGLWRSFNYKDDLFDNLLTYSLGPAPHVGVDAQWYPAAHFTDGFAANIGLEGRFGTILGVESEFQGEKYGTSSIDWGAGLRVRFPFDRDELYGVVGLGGRSFSLDRKAGVPAIPDVSYMFLRAGLGGTFWLGPVSLRASGAYLIVFGAGTSGDSIQSDNWFPHSSASGLEGTAEVGFEFTEGFEVRAGFTLQYFAYTLNPEPDDPIAGGTGGGGSVAGGASDMYPAAMLTLSYTIPAEPAPEE
ncbi:MAG: hypothetical protein KC417_14855 [Myxococcales bacterium]|nr:hypothetical protein [Myxococcales bacterium]